MPVHRHSSVERIDAHQHFWIYTPREYAWIDESMAAIRRNFLPAHLAAEIHAAGIDGVVSVQARQTLEETNWLLSLASQNDFIRAVVGWAPLIDPAVAGILESLAGHSRLKAVRHVLQGEPDDRYMLRDGFNRGIDVLEQFGLVYDILIFERHLPAAIEFVDRHPRQIFVLDHIAKPRIREHLISPWRENLRKLAERENVYCKLSGMITEADYKNWTEEDAQAAIPRRQGKAGTSADLGAARESVVRRNSLNDLAPYFDSVLEVFGPRRLMFGSDWPVCLAATTYSGWFDLVCQQIYLLSEDEQDSILGATATRVYGLDRTAKPR